MFNTKTLKQLQNAYRNNQNHIRYRSADNIFYQLCKQNPSLGVVRHNTIDLDPNAWGKILSLIKDETGLDIACDDIKTLSTKNRLEVSGHMCDEKLLSYAPTKDFIHIRIMGETAKDSYLGIKVTCLPSADNIIIVENFVPFVQLSPCHLALIDPKLSGKTLLVYRGHDHKSVYSHLALLKDLPASIYIFADYDFSGLSIAHDLAHRLLADGVILPALTNSLSTLKPLSKTFVRLAQQKRPPTSWLLPHFDRLERDFLAITQESLLAHQIPLIICYPPRCKTPPKLL